MESWIGKKYLETSMGIGRSRSLRRSMALFRKTVRRLDTGHDGQAPHAWVVQRHGGCCVCSAATDIAQLGRVVLHSEG